MNAAALAELAGAAVFSASSLITLKAASSPGRWQIR